MSACQSVCLSLRLSVRHTPVFCRNGVTYPQTFFTVGYPHHSRFSIPNALAIFRRGMKKNSTNMSLYLRTDVRHECEEETAPKLSNGTISNDLERPLTKISRSRYYSTSNNSKTIQDNAIVTTRTVLTRRVSSYGLPAWVSSELGPMGGTTFTTSAAALEPGHY